MTIDRRVLRGGPLLAGLWSDARPSAGADPEKGPGRGSPPQDLCRAQVRLERFTLGLRTMIVSMEYEPELCDWILVAIHSLPLRACMRPHNSAVKAALDAHNQMIG